jgi:sigma-E factor negative regulatory protein RseA
MTEQQRQHVSALVDSELDAVLVHPTIAALKSSPQLSAVWERYHLIGQAMRGEGVHAEHREIAERVRALIESEPVPVNARRPGQHSHIGPFAGAAVAAAAAFLAVFAVPQLFGPQPTSLTPPTATLATAGPPPQFQISPPANRWQIEQPAVQNKLDRFLVNHHAYSPAAGIKGFMPYATVVGYESGR